MQILAAMGTWVASHGALISLASAGIGAVGAIQQGNAQSAQYEAQAQAYKSQAQAQEYNAAVQRNNAKAAGEQANAAEEAQRRKFAQLQGQAMAAVGQSGTGFDGSNLDVLRQNSVNNELDALNIRYQGQMQAQGLMAQSDLDRMQAQQSLFNAATARSSASSASTAGWIGAGSNLLSGVSNYAYYKNLGTFSKTAGLQIP